MNPCDRNSNVPLEIYIDCTLGAPFPRSPKKELLGEAAKDEDKEVVGRVEEDDEEEEEEGTANVLF